MELNNALILGIVAMLMGGSGVGGFILSRAQSRSVLSQASKIDVETDVIEAKVQPEIDALIVDTLGKTASTLAAENERLSRRLAAADETIARQSHTIQEQAVTIGKQNDVITDYRQQVAALTKKLSAAETMLNEVRNQLQALQVAHPDPPASPA